MKRPYRPPELVEYGRIDRLTLGFSGHQPDEVIIMPGLVVNNNCSPDFPISGLQCQD